MQQIRLEAIWLGQKVLGFGTKSFERRLTFQVASRLGFVATQEISMGLVKRLGLRERMKECFEVRRRVRG